jgi:hypothetical protein
MRTLHLLGRRFRIDFSQTRPSFPLLAWFLLGAGAVSMLAAVADFAPRWSLHRQLAREEAALQARLELLPGAASSAAHAADPIGLTQARVVLDQLQRPWALLFDQFESVRSRDVHLVQFGVDSSFQTVQVLAEAPKLEQVLQYSRQLDGAGPVRAMRLTHHEWRDSPSGRIVVASLTANLRADVRDGRTPR